MSYTVVMTLMMSLLLLEVQTRSIRSVEGEKVKSDEDSRSDVIAYLVRYAYLLKDDPSPEDLKTAVKNFQAVAGVAKSGIIDDRTVAAIRQPRCVRPDVDRRIKMEGSSRVKRYVLANASRWAKSHFVGRHHLKLYWYVSKYTADMPKTVIRNTIKRAFEVWSSQIDIKELPHVKLTFEEASSPEQADINIRWEEGRHGDLYAFDGAGINNENVLAHTFFPDYRQPLNGDIHFDDHERWSNTLHQYTFFPYVLVHEIGHALGLQHSRTEKAIMNPHYRDIALDKIELHRDDKCGINWNYVGPSGQCMAVWIMSEILPIHTGVIQPHPRSTRRRKSLPSIEHRSSLTQHTSELTQQQKIKQIKKQLKRAIIPQCREENTIRSDVEVLLQKQLHFPDDEARIYGEVACRFLHGLHVYRSEDGTTTNHLDSSFGTVREFASADENDVHHLFKRELKRYAHHEPSILDLDYFDEAFFDKFFADY